MKFSTTWLSFFLVALVFVAGCNNRGRTRGPIGDSSISVDSSTGDGGDTSTPTDTGVPVDTSVPPDTSTPGACPIYDESGVAGPITTGTTEMMANNHGGTCGGDSAPEAIVIWSAPTTGAWTLDTIGSDFDTVLYVRDTTCSGTELACNDDSSGTQSSVTISAIGGSTYYVFVDGFSTNSGNFVLNATEGAP